MNNINNHEIYSQNIDNTRDDIDAFDNIEFDINSDEFRKILNLVQHSIVFIDTLTLQPIFWNKFLERNIQCNLEEFATTNISKFLKLETGDINQLILDISKNSKKIITPIKAKLYTKNNAEIDVKITFHNAQYSGKNAVLLLITNISDSNRMEKLLIRSQRLETLNSMISGIAHDFNNILTGIVMNVQLAKNKIEPTNIIYNFLNTIEVEIKQSRRLTQQMQSFSENAKPVKTISSLRELLVDAISFTLRGTNVVSKFSIVKNLWFVNIDATQVNQVISNISLNAIQAMPNGGILTVSAENVTISDDSKFALKPGFYVKLAIKDMGVGIHGEIKDKIFDKFYTTKKNQAGLGLTVAKSIIENHEGIIDFETDENTGSTFTIYLPAIEQSAMIKSKKTKNDKHVGKILIMDDENTIRNTLKSYLCEIGYVVDCAAEGKEAIRLFTKGIIDEDAFDLLILDLTIPGGLGGKQTLQKLMEIDTNFKSIVTSGYSNDPILYDYKKYGFDNVLLKPYNLDDLEKMVRNLIND
ncbi:MAG: response regulator [Planctomycetes bacterium]|nr:response regulator [Planctomycetota bacterium]